MDYRSLILILPELLLSALSLLILVGEALWPTRRKLWVCLGTLGLLFAVGHQMCFFAQKAAPWASALGLPAPATKNGWIQYPPIMGMLSVDSLAAFFKIAIAAGSILILWMSADDHELVQRPAGTYVALVLIGTIGMMLLTESVDFLMAIVALEMLSVSSFVLAGFALDRPSSAEGAIKYLLVGTFSTAIFLFGVSYYYGYFGTTHLTPLLDFPNTGLKPDFVLSVLLVFLVAGIGFKLALFPFYLWAPDTYEGSPTPVTAFLSMAPAATVAFLLRFLGRHAELGLTPILAVLAALTMTVGNVGALVQTNLKRLLAYSSIAQMGYVMVAFVVGGSLGTQATMAYTFLYLFMNLGVFAVVTLVANSAKSADLPALTGLSGKSLGLSLALVALLLSLVGLPPLSGFAGKFAIYAAVLSRPEFLWLAIVAAINSVISLCYYFRLVRYAFLREALDPWKPIFPPLLVGCLIVAVLVTVAAGVLPNHVLGWVRNVVGS